MEETITRAQLDTGRRFNREKNKSANLCTLCQTTALGTVVSRSSVTATVMRELGVSEFRVRYNDNAKFGTKALRNRPLWTYAQRRPLPYEKTTKRKIGQDIKNLEKKYRETPKPNNFNPTTYPEFRR